LLVAAGDEDAWSRRVLARRERGLKVEVRGMRLRDAAQWQREMEIGPGGAILVRPDGHVAWRCRTARDAETWDGAMDALEGIYVGAR
jgi:hypothetical protein